MPCGHVEAEAMANSSLSFCFLFPCFGANGSLRRYRIKASPLLSHTWGTAILNICPPDKELTSGEKYKLVLCSATEILGPLVFATSFSSNWLIHPQERVPPPTTRRILKFYSSMLPSAHQAYFFLVAIVNGIFFPSCIIPNGFWYRKAINFYKDITSVIIHFTDTLTFF